MSLRLIPLLLAALSATAHAESGAVRAAGEAIGELAAGAARALTGPLADGRPEWITIAPRSKEDCIAASGGILNSVYMRCRNGRQEYVKHDADGGRRVLAERPIPRH